MESKKTMTQLTEQQIEAQIEKAIANSIQIEATEPRANKVLFDDGRINIHFDNGAIFSVMSSSVQDLASLSPEDLATVELTPSRKGLRWDALDIDLSIQGLLLGIFGSSLWMKEIAALGGKSTSHKKKAASRANGKKGGRPKVKLPD
jgi:hypothetical protein